MRIKMLVSVAGDNFSIAPGEITDLFSDDSAKRYIESGQAVAVETAPKVETRKGKARK